MSNSRDLKTENEIVENFLREQHEQSFDGGSLASYGNGALASGDVMAFGEEEKSLTEDIRKIARALAPQISELEDVMRDFSDAEAADALDRFNHTNDISRSMMEEEDDDLDDEISRLSMSEQALREELEFAAGMSMLGSPSPIREAFDARDTKSASNLPAPVDLNSRLGSHQQRDQFSSRASDSDAYTLQDHADYLELKTEPTGQWYYIQMTSKLLPTAVSGSSLASKTASEPLVKDYCLPIPFRKLKRVYGGLVFYDVWENKRKKAAQHTPSRSPAITPKKTPLFNRLLQTPAKSTTTPSATTPGGYTMPVPATPATPATAKNAPSTPNVPPRTPLQPINSSSFDNNSKNSTEEPLPVRTIAIRVRPDVLCGAIMDAAHHAFEILPDYCTTHIIKRQGGHLRGAVYLPKEQLAYVADIQLCTQKNDALERRLLLRFYHIQDDPDALSELGQILHRKQQQSAANENKGNDPPTSYSSSISDTENNDVMAKERSIANRHLKQTCSLIQRIMAAEKQKGGLERMDHKQQSRYVYFLSLFCIGFASQLCAQQFHCYSFLIEQLVGIKGRTIRFEGCHARCNRYTFRIEL